MQIDDEHAKLTYGGSSLGARVQRVLVKGLAVAASLIVLFSAIAISVVLFVVVLAGILAFGFVFWWKTRELRKQMRSHQWNPGQRTAGLWDASVIEGEVVRDDSSDDKKKPPLR